MWIISKLDVFSLSFGSKECLPTGEKAFYNAGNKSVTVSNAGLHIKTVLPSMRFKELEVKIASVK